MRLQDWTRDLAARGITVTAPTSVVPVDLWALDPDGRGLHLRCRGTRVRLTVWAADDLRRALPGDVVDLPGHPARGERLVAVEADPDAPLAVWPGALPLDVAEVDGSARYGWDGCEAGRLTVGEAADLLDELLLAVSPAGVVAA